MKSPYPGMDTYIEQYGLWEDFHMHLTEKIYESLADRVPANYVVRTAVLPPLTREARAVNAQRQVV